MKKAFLILALFAGTVTLSQAQPGGQQRTPEERAKMQVSRLPETLKLTADQKTKIESIFLSQAKSMDSLRTAGGGDREAMFAKLAPIRQETDKKISAILDEDQKKAFAAYQEEARKRMGQGGRGQGGQRPN